jgi:hypothetical protein
LGLWVRPTELLTVSEERQVHGVTFIPPATLRRETTWHPSPVANRLAEDLSRMAPRRTIGAKSTPASRVNRM